MPDAQLKEKVGRLVRDLVEPSSEMEGRILFGPGGRLDSLGLVNLLADVEMAVSEELGYEIVLASEKAMSRKRSPFRNVESLVEFTCELIDEARHEGRGTGGGDPV